MRKSPFSPKETVFEIVTLPPLIGWCLLWTLIMVGYCLFFIKWWIYYLPHCTDCNVTEWDHVTDDTHTHTIFAGWKLANNQWFHWMWIQESPKVNGRPKAKATRYAWRNAAVLRLAVERRWNSELFGAAEGTQCGNRESFEGLENVQCIVLCNYAGFSVSGLVNHEIQLKINPSIQTDHKWAQQVTCP